MDLSKVHNKLSRSEYSSVDDCLDDIRKIWSNCKQYNGEVLSLCDRADEMSKKLDALVEVGFVHSNLHSIRV